MSKHFLSPLLLIVFSLPALASLGGNTATVENDRANMQASIRASHFANFDVHEMQASTGTFVREYISPDGKVFAVAWNGPALPDMKQVLGNYFEQFRQAAHAQAGHHAPIAIHESGLVVETGGHMRSFGGRAYVPQMMPEGVRVQDVR